MISELVSVIVPVYNVEHYLVRCVESLINQTYQQIEIILVNDGSKDKSGVICNQLATQDKRIVVIHKMNGGLSSARNEGLKHCKGGFISFLDSDDWYDHETFTKGMDIIKENDADIVFWSCVKEYQNDKHYVKSINTREEKLIFEGNRLNRLQRRTIGLTGDELRQPTKTDVFISAWGKIYKRKLIFESEVEFIDTKIVGSEDVAFNIEMFNRASKIVYLNEFLTHYWLENENSLTKNHGSTLYPRFNLYFWIDNYIKVNSLDSTYKQALENRFALSLINNVLSISSNRNKCSVANKIHDINKILRDSIYIRPLKQMQRSYLPKHWKIFFALAQLKLGAVLYLITISYMKIRDI
jgi:glycosyltransferase involved in cell wall biosynthesis